SKQEPSLIHPSTLPHRNGIEAARMPGMAAYDAPEGEEPAGGGPMAGQRLCRVVRAAGGEPAAGRDERGQQPLVAADQGDQDGGGRPRLRSWAKARTRVRVLWPLGHG